MELQSLKVIYDNINHKKYYKGSLMGKGGFAKCYEMYDSDTNELLVGKFIDKRILIKDRQKAKLVQEISIHRRLNHENIVRFHSFFEDENNVYIILENCKRKSLLELLRYRQCLTETECRYIMKKVATGCLYLHSMNIVHRDLKLSNILVNHEGCIKIGDFGLSTIVEFPGQIKKTVCGTPNYIAPEVLNKKGHSFQVDAWSLGCILYTLLVGSPPFETRSLQETYFKIKRVDYVMPNDLSSKAKSLISGLLIADVSKRLTIDDVLKHEFLSEDLINDIIPSTYVPNRINNLISSNIIDMVKKEECKNQITLTEAINEEKISNVTDKFNIIDLNDKQKYSKLNDKKTSDLETLYYHLSKTISSSALETQQSDISLTNPTYWVDKWVDYSDKYGLGYQLSDQSFGVLFNDNTKLLFFDNKVKYIERSAIQNVYNVDEHPEHLTKKVTLLKYFKNYMNEHLLKASSCLENIRSRTDNIPYLRTWYRTKAAILLYLSNGLVQINFFDDHTKLLMSSKTCTISHFDENRKLFTHTLLRLEKRVCCDNSHLKYALAMLEKLLETSLV